MWAVLIGDYPSSVIKGGGNFKLLLGGFFTLLITQAR